MVSKIRRDVFRDILDYQIPNELSYRYSDPCGGIIKDSQDRHFPAIGKLDYHNNLVALNGVKHKERF